MSNASSGGVLLDIWIGFVWTDCLVECLSADADFLLRIACLSERPRLASTRTWFFIFLALVEIKSVMNLT